MPYLLQGREEVNVGDRYALSWRHPHLLDLTIVAFERDAVLVDVTHRCTLGCYLKQMQNTLPIDGRRHIPYAEFGNGTWLAAAPDAIALPGMVTAEKSYALIKPRKVERPVRELTGWRLVVDVAREQRGRNV